MAEYISKQAFNYAIREAVRKYPNTFYNGLEVARQIAHDMDAADVVQVRHGRWMLIEYPYGQKTYLCSECKDDEWWKGRYAYGDELYCPNCGAKMDGEE